MHLVRGSRCGNFLYDGDDVSVGPGSARRLPFRCACGKTGLVRVANVMNGQKKCGRCNSVTLTNGAQYGSLTYVGATADVGRGSHKRLSFRCECGNERAIEAKLVLNGRTASCGRCSEIALNSGDDYHGFTYLGPNTTVKPMSPQKLEFRCSCGRSALRSIGTVTSGRSKSCGKCDVMELLPGQEYMSFTYVGKPVSVTPGSKRKLRFMCRCGTVKLIQVGSVTRGDSTKCGSCYTPAALWYERNEEQIRSIRCPATAADFPDGGVVPSGVVVNTTDPFDATCPACSAPYRPYLHCVKRGISLTCGCTNNKVSRMNHQVAEFIRELGADPVHEFKLQDRFYDVAVPNRKLLIELHGLKWHSGRKAHAGDLRKFRDAVSAGYGVLAIFEDEWKRKREVMESLIANRLGMSSPKKLRPSHCDIGAVKPGDAASLYERFHYIGKSPSTHHYGVSYGGEIIGCASFRKPSRQRCNGDYEISRMVMDPRYLVHGVWSKIMAMFVEQVNPGSVITFSDNRLFTGSAYGKIGFKFDGEVKPDYYWVRNGRRFNKSSMRKPAGCTETETSLRTSQGYHKIWDYGKTRWRWDDSNSTAPDRLSTCP